MKQLPNIQQLIMWGIFALILLVLLPHTAWFFGLFEPGEGYAGIFSAWSAAIAFEAGLAVMVHKSAGIIGKNARRRKDERFVHHIRRQYFNAYALGVVMFIAVSLTANIWHALVYSGFNPVAILAGGILPVASGLFAWVLAKEQKGESEAASREIEMKKTITELRRDLDKVKELQPLVKGNKTERIQAVKAWKSELNNTAIAVITGAAPATVTKALNGSGK